MSRDYAKAFFTMGTILVLGLIIMFTLVEFFSFSGSQGKTFVCFDGDQVLFEVEQTNDFFKWANGYHKYSTNSGVSVVSKDGTRYFCSENWKLEKLK